MVSWVSFWHCSLIMKYIKWQRWEYANSTILWDRFMYLGFNDGYEIWITRHMSSIWETTRTMRINIIFGSYARTYVQLVMTYRCKLMLITQAKHTPIMSSEQSLWAGTSKSTFLHTYESWIWVFTLMLKMMSWILIISFSSE